MSDAARLQEAFELIEKGDLNNARQLLNPLRNRMQNEPDFWWVYAHAVETQDEGREAIQQLRQLDNAYPGLETLERRLDTVPRPKMLPPSPVGMPDLPGDDFDDDFDFTDDEPAPSSNRLRNIILGVLGLLLIVVIAVLALPRILAPSAEPTAIAGLNNTTPEPILPTENVVTTEEATESMVQPTLETEVTSGATPETSVEVTEGSAQSITDMLSVDFSAFQVPTDGVQIGTTALGESVIVDLCTAQGPATTNAIIGIIDYMVSNDIAVPMSAQAVAFSVKDCASATELIQLGLNIADVTTYMDGSSTRAQLIQAMRRID